MIIKWALSIEHLWLKKMQRQKKVVYCKKGVEGNPISSDVGSST